MDFKYIFEDHIHIVGLYNRGENILDFIKKDMNKDKFIIICEYNPSIVMEKLEIMGLTKNVDFAAADSFFYSLDFPIKEIATKREVYVWGTGDKSHHFFHEFIEHHPDIEIAGSVDSNPDKRGMTWFRRPVFSPEEVINHNSFFIIASDDYYDEIREILIKNGKKSGYDFVHYTALNTRASWMMRETVYDVPRLDYVCHKPFNDAVLSIEGRLSVCAGIMGMEKWGVPGYYSDFSSIWHSNIMKVLRLSVLNGTYSFCNKGKCNYLSECNQQEIDIKEIHYHTHRSKEQIQLIAEKNLFDKDKIFNRENYKIKEKNYPEVVFMSFDYSCNLNCPSCRKAVTIVKGKQKQQMKAFDERMKRELYLFTKKIKSAGNGEVFASEIHKSTIFDRDIAKTVKKVGILSNGTLFKPEVFDKLNNLYEEINVFISMDGYKKETVEKLRAGADFATWKENMAYLGQMRKQGKINNLSFNFVVQKDNYREMPAFARMCLDFSADAIKFSKIFNMGAFQSNEFREVAMFDELGHMLPELEEVVQDEIFKRPEVHLFTWVDW